VTEKNTGKGLRLGVAAALASAAVAALALSSTAFARPATTAPTKLVNMLVLIDDKGISLHLFNGRDSGSTLDTMSGPIPRGDYITINVYNRGRRKHNFTLFGKKTPSIKPGGKAHLFAIAVSRGRFPYRSTLDRETPFRGYVTVA